MNETDNNEDFLQMIGRVKKMTRMIAEEEIGNNPLEEGSRKKEADLKQLNYDMFSHIKNVIDSFTILDDADLKEIHLDEENTSDEYIAGAVKEKLTSLGDIQVFYILAAQIIYLFDSGKNEICPENEYRLLYLKVRSKHSNDNRFNDVFYVNCRDDFYILTDHISDMTLLRYLDIFWQDFTDEFRHENGNLNLQDEMSERLFRLQNELRSKGDNKSIQELINDDINRGRIFFKTTFNNGAITFLDFLGWKGIWQTNKNALNEVHELIEFTTEKANKLTDEILTDKSYSGLTTVLSISDTIAIFTPKIEELGLTIPHILNLHANLSNLILTKSTEKFYPVRGAISYGRYSIQKNLMIGPGIDECTDCHESCDWIGVHFTPRAELILRSQDIRSTYIMEYENIPVKPNYPKPEYCIRWSVPEEKFMMLIDNVKIMSSGISGKYLNTYNFLCYESQHNMKSEKIS